MHRTDVTYVLAPIDQGVRNLGGRDGAALGPARLMAALRERGVAAPDEPVFEVPVGNTEASLEDDLTAVADAVEGVLREQRFPVVLGGDHGITYATVSGLSRVATSCAVAYVDVHLDMRPFKPHHTSGSSFRRLVEEGVVVGRDVHPIGIERPTDAQALVRSRFDELASWGDEHQITYDTLAEVNERGPAEALDHAIGSGPSWCLSFDVDALDERFAPGVSAPGPGRFELDAVAEAVRAVAPRLACFDIVEYAPRLDVGDRTLASAVAVIAALVEGLNH